MSEQVRYCHDFVNQPYPRVRELLIADPHLALRSAMVAASGAAIEIIGVESDYGYNRLATKISLEWRAIRSPRIFPAMSAELVVSVRSANETKLELRGSYRPAADKHGDGITAADDHPFSEASMSQFLAQLAGWLRAQLGLSRAMTTVENPARSLASVNATSATAKS